MARPDAGTIWSEPLWVDTTSISTSVPYTVVDLCCGCGGFTLGFQQAGYVPLLGIEMDPWATATFRRNFSHVPLLESRIERLADSQILEALDGRCVDVICCGLPCQGFSTNGKRLADDARNWLFTQLARVAELLWPYAVVVENVPPIASVHDGAFARWLQAAFADLGYDATSLGVLNAADYGVPQARERAVIVASRCGPTPFPLPILDEPFHRSVDSAIGDLRGLPQGAVANHLWPEAGPEMGERIRRTRPGDPLHEGFRGGCRRLRSDAPAVTIRANHGQPHLHPHEDRFLSVREMARLQGFPDRFTIEGNVRQQQDQVANAIPPPLAEHVALALRPLLDSVGELTGDAETERGQVAWETPDVLAADGPPSRSATVVPPAEPDEPEHPPAPMLVPVESHHHVRHPGLPVSAIIEGNNLDALNALLTTHRGQIDSIFVDPPYNTGTTASYENSFDDDEWLEAISQRLRVARELLTRDGIICITIGDAQLFSLGVLADRVFDRRNRLADVVVAHNETGHAGRPFREVHEHYLFYARDLREATISLEPIDDEGRLHKLIEDFPYEDAGGRYRWENLVRRGSHSRPADRPTMCYPVYVDHATGRVSTRPFDGATEVLPEDADGEPRRWLCSPATVERWASEGELRVRAITRGGRPAYAIDRRVRPTCEEGIPLERPSNVWLGPELNAATHGAKLLTRMIGPNPFSYPKSIHAVKRALRLMVGHKPDATVLDPYAGSGITAHALLMLNAEDGGRRRFILVNSNELTNGRGSDQRRICEEICLPRVRAAIEGYEYHSKGRTVHVPGLPGNFRYYRAGPVLGSTVLHDSSVRPHSTVSASGATDSAASSRGPADGSLADWIGRFHQGDCVELMERMPEGSVDLIVCSPPYNLRNSTGNGMRSRAGGKWRNAALKDGYAHHDDDMPHDEYVAWQRRCLESMMRVLADDGAIFYNHKWRVQGGLLQDRREIVDGFPVRQTIIWRRKGGINFNPGYFLPTYEVIYLICKPGFRLAPGANALTDVWEIPQERDNPHPAPFPVELAERCIRSTTAEVILDPFMGSGSTAIAAERLGRRWIGIDISDQYCRMAEERMASQRAGGVLRSSP